jgi:hypothetical protein
MRTPFAIALIASCAAVPVAAQVAPASTAAERPNAAFVRADAEAAVRQLAIHLEENFVFPKIGTQYAAMLRANLEGGVYPAPTENGSRTNSMPGPRDTHWKAHRAAAIAAAHC